MIGRILTVIIADRCPDPARTGESVDAPKSAGHGGRRDGRAAEFLAVEQNREEHSGRRGREARIGVPKMPLNPPNLAAAE